MITRRTHSREYTLRPDPEMTELMQYLVAVGVKRFGMKLVAAVAMSTHYHQVLVDVEGRHPEYTHWLNGLLAHRVNRLRRRRGGLWSADQPEVTLLADDAAVLKEAAYTLANPVQDGAVPHGRDWPGFRTTPNAFTAPPKQLTRPASFSVFSDLPKTIELKLEVPPTHAHLTAAQFARQLSEAVAHREAEARTAMKKANRTFGTARAARRRPWTTRSVTPEPDGPRTRPREVVGGDSLARDLLEAQVLDFREAYRLIRSRWLDGNREVIWPWGTWLMRTRHKVEVDRPPPQ